jgi:4-hydroxy-4-methyl-2-oxoglutarate aldolase
MTGRGALDYLIKPVDPTNASFVGPAITAHAFPADVVGVLGALGEAQPGDVVVVATDSHTSTACIGDLVAGMMQNKAVAAFVTDGLGRDKKGIIESRLPLFCRGINPNSPAANGPGTVGAPIVCGGVLVKSGDIIVGDEDGVVVVPLEHAEAVLVALDAVRAAEEKAVAAVASGITTNDRINMLLANAKIVGVPF